MHPNLIHIVYFIYYLFTFLQLSSKCHSNHASHINRIRTNRSLVRNIRSLVHNYISLVCNYRSLVCTCNYRSLVCNQGCGNIEPTTGHFDLFSSPLSCYPCTLYTVQFQFTGHSLDLSDNVLHDWLFPHHCM